MKNLFEHTSAKWVRYSDYEYKEKTAPSICYRQRMPSQVSMIR